jgi:hypothetical protein
MDSTQFEANKQDAFDDKYQSAREQQLELVPIEKREM